MRESSFLSSRNYQPANWIDYRGVRFADTFGDAADEYRALHEGAVVCDRGDRGVVLITGRDRRMWLNNLVTNAIKALDPGAGAYAFACDVRGRTVFDANILAFEDSLWLDLDFDTIGPALQHLDLRLITEDVQMRDHSPEWARLGIAGPNAATIVDALGVSNGAAMADLQHVAIGDLHLMRHDFTGLPGFEIFVPQDQAPHLWDRLTDELQVTPCGFNAIDAARIQAGLPWSGRDIDSEVVPPETGQIERGVNYAKGCYLGQEVIERMRSRGVAARRLVRLAFNQPLEAPIPAPLTRAESVVGRLTSFAPHPTQDGFVGLGYVKANIPDEGDLHAGGVKVRITT